MSRQLQTLLIYRHHPQGLMAAASAEAGANSGSGEAQEHRRTRLRPCPSPQQPGGDHWPHHPPCVRASIWSGCSVRIRLWPRLPHGCHRLRSIRPQLGANTVCSEVSAQVVRGRNEHAGRLHTHKGKRQPEWAIGVRAVMQPETLISWYFQVDSGLNATAKGIMGPRKP